MSICSDGLQHHDALQLAPVDACASCGVLLVPDLTALCIPSGEVAISKNAHLFTIPKGERGLSGHGFLHAGEFTAAVRFEEVPEQLGGLDVLVAPDAEPLVTAPFTR